MSDNKLFKNNIGVQIKVWAGVDISDATSIIISVRKPSGAVVSWTATVDTDNPDYAIYTTVSGDLDQAGKHVLSLVITLAGGKIITGQADTFVVYDQFYDLVC